jgi:hypothetical protein
MAKIITAGIAPAVYTIIELLPRKRTSPKKCCSSSKEGEKVKEIDSNIIS